MIKRPSKQTLKIISKLVKEAGGDGSFHLSPIYVCDHCENENREAFPCGVYDAQGKFWNDLCNDCWDILGCSIEMSEWFTETGDDYVDLSDHQPV